MPRCAPSSASGAQRTGPCASEKARSTSRVASELPSSRQRRRHSPWLCCVRLRSWSGRNRALLWAESRIVTEPKERDQPPSTASTVRARLASQDGMVTPNVCASFPPSSRVSAGRLAGVGQVLGADRRHVGRRAAVALGFRECRDREPVPGRRAGIRRVVNAGEAILPALGFNLRDDGEDRVGQVRRRPWANPAGRPPRAACWS